MMRVTTLHFFWQRLVGRRGAASPDPTSDPAPTPTDNGKGSAANAPRAASRPRRPPTVGLPVVC